MKNELRNMLGRRSKAAAPEFIGFNETHQGEA
jgi:hypothetical protein